MVKDRIGAEQLVEELRLQPPKVVGFPLYSYNLASTYRLIRRIKEALPSVHVCVGGPHASIFSRETIGLPHVDSVVLGDGEVPFLGLVRQIIQEGGLDSGRLPSGVHTKESLRAGLEPTPYVHDDLDSLPTPDLSLLGDHRRYRDFLSDKVMGILTSSRGCPFVCHYCWSEKSKYRPFSISKVVENMRRYRDAGVEYIEFWDETFNPNKRRLEEFATALEAADLDLTWAIRGAVVNHVSAEVLARLRRTGLRIIQFGVETFSPRSLKFLNKKIDQRMVRDAFAACAQAGVRTVANAMIGIPGQTRQELEEDLEQLRRLRPTYVSISVYNWAPGTTHYSDALRTGELQRDHWREHARVPLEVDPVEYARCELPVEEVFRLRDDFVSNHYFNLRFVVDYLRQVDRREVARAASIAGSMLRSNVRGRLDALRRGGGTRAASPIRSAD
jgi:radical SAM superfamily enzyme YgiQ (UPF0313 family)